MPRKDKVNSAELAKRPAEAANKSKAGGSATTPSQKVLGFYSDRAGHPYREFSNFFIEAPPFLFVLPDFARQEELPHSFECEFSEKAIMLAKASMMNDPQMLSEIAKATNPKDCKALGRGVRGFDPELWDRHLEELAFDVVRQKFDACPALKKVLLSTGDKVLAEAAPNDQIWGIGLSLKDDRVFDPEQWCGRNVLGYALMRARSYLRGDAAVTIPSAGYSCTEASAACTTAPAPGFMPEPSQDQANHSTPGSLEVDSEKNFEVDPDENFLRPISDLAAVVQCYEKYGVVGVTGVLSQEECQGLVRDGLEPFLPKGCSMDDVQTFNLADRATNRYGVIGKQALFNSAILDARLHANVAAAYGAVYGRPDVFACHDRAAWMRPASVNSSWTTPFSWPGLHFDISLPSYFGNNKLPVEDFLKGIDYDNGHWAAENNAKHKSMGRTVQGVLNLYDNEEEDGGFQCVPGMFGPRLEKWVQCHPGLPKEEANGKYELKGFGVDAELGSQAVRVPCPAGTLILFDATLPHGTRPSTSSKSRAILFLRYISSDELPASAWRKRNAALRRLTEKLSFKPDKEQVKRMYGPE